MNHEHNKYSGYGISSDELLIIIHLPRERKEPLYSKLHDAKMMKTSTGKKISVIVRLPKTLVSSKEYQCVPVFIKVRAILVLVKDMRKISQRNSIRNLGLADRNFCTTN